MIIRDYLICLLQMYLLEDLEKNILPYRRERFWEKFRVNHFFRGIDVTTL